ncbi:MAG: Kelch repeat-containing protein, partial [Myxococcales bacterium]|nr:Kelch repeat-containing protein [Myxococcales bacterium]
TPSNSMLDVNVALMPTAVYGAGAALGDDGNLYVLLGQCTTGGCPHDAGQDSVMSYDETLKAWLPYRAPLKNPTLRGRVGSTAAPDGRIYVVGGSSEQMTGLATVEAYTPKTNNWATVASLNYQGISITTVLGKDGRIYALAGAALNAGKMTFRNVVEAYGPSLTLVSATGTAGTMQALTGSNFAASAPVRIYFGTEPTPISTTQTDSAGQLPVVVTYKIPSGIAPGTYDLKVVDLKSNYPAFARVTVTP